MTNFKGNAPNPYVYGGLASRALVDTNGSLINGIPYTVSNTKAIYRFNSDGSVSSFDPSAPGFSTLTQEDPGTAYYHVPKSGATAFIVPTVIPTDSSDTSLIMVPTLIPDSPANFTLDCTSQANLTKIFRINLSVPRTITAIANPFDGQRITLQLKQGGNGGNTLTFPSNVIFSTSAPQSLFVPSLSTGLTDVASMFYTSSSSKWCVDSYLPGFLV